MNDVERSEDKPKISNLTSAEAAAVGGAYISQCQAPAAPALYDDRVFVSSERTGSLFP